MVIIPTISFVIRFLTETNDKEVNEVVVSLESGEKTLFLPTVVLLEVIKTLNTERLIPLYKIARPLITVLESGCLEIEEKDIVIQALYASTPMHHNYWKSFFDAYIRFKSIKMGLEQMPENTEDRYKYMDEEFILLLKRTK